MASNTSSFLKKQKIAVGALAAIVIGIVGYFSFVALQDAPLIEGFVEGEHYFVLENPRRVRGDKVEVMEFFSYACPHCYSFEPTLNRWVTEQGENVRFVRTPAVASDYWRLLGRNYYTLEAMDLIEEEHLAFFREIHDLKRQFASPELLARHYEERGVDIDEYRATFNSPEVAQAVALADQLARRMQVASVPTIVVHGRYVVRVSRAVGPNRMLDVIEFLINEINTEREAANAPPAQES